MSSHDVRHQAVVDPHELVATVAINPHPHDAAALHPFVDRCGGKRRRERIGRQFAASPSAGHFHVRIASRQMHHPFEGVSDQLLVAFARHIVSGDVSHEPPGQDESAGLLGRPVADEKEIRQSDPFRLTRVLVWLRPLSPSSPGSEQILVDAECAKQRLVVVRLGKRTWAPQARDHALPLGVIVGPCLFPLGETRRLDPADQGARLRRLRPPATARATFPIERSKSSGS